MWREKERKLRCADVIAKKEKSHEFQFNSVLTLKKGIQSRFCSTIIFVQVIKIKKKNFGEYEMKIFTAFYLPRVT